KVDYEKVRDLIIAGNMESALAVGKILKKEDSLILSLEPMAYGGHLYYMEQWVKKNKIIQPSPYLAHYLSGSFYNSDFIHASYRFKNKLLARHSLSFVKDDNFFDFLLKVFDKENEKTYLKYSLPHVIAEAKAIRKVMKEDQLDYEEAVECLSAPDLQLFKVKKLTQVYGIKPYSAEILLTERG